jgi:hypothetical protein
MIMICNGFLSFARDNQLSDQYIYHDEVIKQFFFSFMFGCFLWYQSIFPSICKLGLLHHRCTFSLHIMNSISIVGYQQLLTLFANQQLLHMAISHVLVLLPNFSQPYYIWGKTVIISI